MYRLYSSLVFFLFCLTSFSQISLRVYSFQHLNVCTETGNFEIQLNNHTSASLSSINFRVDLPSWLIFDSTAFASSGDTVISMSPLIVRRGAILPKTKASIFIPIKASCEAISYLNQDNNIYVSTTIASTNYTYKCPITNGRILYPKFRYLPHVTTYDLILNKSSLVETKLINVGTGTIDSFAIEVFNDASTCPITNACIYDVNSMSCLQSLTGNITYVNGRTVIPILSSDIYAAFGSYTISTNQVFYIQYEVSPSGCIANQTLKSQVSWGCSGASPCDSNSGNLYFNYLNNPSVTSSVEISEVSTCGNTGAQLQNKVKIVNSGDEVEMRQITIELPVKAVKDPFYNVYTYETNYYNGLTLEIDTHTIVIKRNGVILGYDSLISRLGPDALNYKTSGTFFHPEKEISYQYCYRSSFSPANIGASGADTILHFKASIYLPSNIMLGSNDSITVEYKTRYICSDTAHIDGCNDFFNYYLDSVEGYSTSPFASKVKYSYTTICNHNNEPSLDSVLLNQRYYRLLPSDNSWLNTRSIGFGSTANALQFAFTYSSLNVPEIDQTNAFLEVSMTLDKTVTWNTPSTSEITFNTTWHPTGFGTGSGQVSYNTSGSQKDTIIIRVPVSVLNATYGVSRSLRIDDLRFTACSGLTNIPNNVFVNAVFRIGGNCASQCDRIVMSNWQIYSPSTCLYTSALTSALTANDSMWVKKNSWGSYDANNDGVTDGAPNITTNKTRITHGDTVLMYMKTHVTTTSSQYRFLFFEPYYYIAGNSYVANYIPLQANLTIKKYLGSTYNIVIPYDKLKAINYSIAENQIAYNFYINADSLRAYGFTSIPSTLKFSGNDSIILVLNMKVSAEYYFMNEDITASGYSYLDMERDVRSFSSQLTDTIARTYTYTSGLYSTAYSTPKQMPSADTCYIYKNIISMQYSTTPGCDVSQLNFSVYSGQSKYGLYTNNFRNEIKDNNHFRKLKIAYNKKNSPNFSVASVTVLKYTGTGGNSNTSSSSTPVSYSVPYYISSTSTVYGNDTLILDIDSLRKIDPTIDAYDESVRLDFTVLLNINCLTSWYKTNAFGNNDTINYEGLSTSSFFKMEYSDSTRGAYALTFNNYGSPYNYFDISNRGSNIEYNVIKASNTLIDGEVLAPQSQKLYGKWLTYFLYIPLGSVSIDYPTLSIINRDKFRITSLCNWDSSSAACSLTYDLKDPSQYNYEYFHLNYNDKQIKGYNTYQVTVELIGDNCQSDTVKFAIGTGCAYPYDDPADPFKNVCDTEFITLNAFMEPLEGGLQASLESPTDLVCTSSALYTINLIGSGEANTKDININVKIDPGLAFDYATIEYMGNSNSVGTYNLNGDSLQFYVDQNDPNMINDGFYGALHYDKDSNIAKINLYFRIICPYDQDTLRNIFTITANNVCGEALTPYYFDSGLTNDTMFKDGNDYSFMSKSLTTSGCSQNFATWKFKNEGPYNSENDSVIVTLPPSLRFYKLYPIRNVESTYTIINNNLYFRTMDMPEGDSMEFRVQYGIISSTDCHEMDSIKVTLKNTRDLTPCGLCMIDTVLHTYYSDTFSINLPKLILTFTSDTGTIVGNKYNYTYSYSILNSGSPKAYGDTVFVDFFCDKNNDGIIQSNEYIFSDTVLNAIATGGSFNSGLHSQLVDTNLCHSPNFHVLTKIAKDRGSYGGGNNPSCICDSSLNTNFHILPLKYISFNANWYDDNDAQLKWITTNEINNDRFEIERSSDGINFTKIGKVKSVCGTCTRVNNYQYIDRNAALIGPVIYYRIKQIDYNNQVGYTNIEVLQSKKEGTPTLSIVPNPFINSFSLSIQYNSEFNLDYIITDMQGRFITSEHLKGLNEYKNEIDLSKYDNGVYFLQITINGLSYNYKLVKGL